MFSPSGFYDAIANTLTEFLKSLFLKLILEQLFLTLPHCLAFKVKLKNLLILEGMKLVYYQRQKCRLSYTKCENYLNLSDFFSMSIYLTVILNLGICCTLKTFNQCANLGHMGNLEQLFLYIIIWLYSCDNSFRVISQQKKAGWRICICKDFSYLL